MNNIIFLDTEFTDFLNPQLLSLGMVTRDGQEHYLELDRNDPSSASALAQASDFVRFGGVLIQWDRIPGSKATLRQMGERTAHWLLDAAARCGGPVLLAHDYAPDYELIEFAIRDAGLWEQVRQVVQPLKVHAITGTVVGEEAAERCFESLRSRGLARHHALADAHALRAAYLAVTALQGDAQ